MAKGFEGTINVDIRDSTPDWSPFEPPKAPDGAPNVVYIVLDDVGFSAMSCYGGPIDTPNIDRIAADGVRYTQLHTTALCSPTRSCLLTGRNHTRNSMACITEAAIGFPNASGTIPPENGMLSEILGELGWNTYMVGKWHLCPDDEMNLAVDAAELAERPGVRALVRVPGRRDEPVVSRTSSTTTTRSTSRSPPRRATTSPRTSPTRRSSSSRTRRRSRPRSPSSSTTRRVPRHAPHHVAEGVERPVQGPLRHGLRGDARADARPAEGAGHRPGRHRAAADQPDRHAPRRAPGPTACRSRRWTRRCPWDSLSDDEKRLFARMAEVYAGFLSHADHHIGRLLDYLEATGQRENTLVIVVSDNGASGEGGPNGSVNEMKFANGIPDDMASNLAMLDELGSPKTYNHYPNGWAMAFNTPFKMWKRYEFNGGTCDPCIISWPAGHEGEGRAPRRSTTTRSTSCPRSWTSSASSRPRRSRATCRADFDGVSMRYSFDDASAPSTRTTQFYSMLGSRGIWHDGWKADHEPPHDRRLEPLQRRRVGAVPHRRRPRRSCTTWPSEHPDKVRELVNLWFAEAGANGAFPLDDRSAARDHHHPAAGALAAAEPLRLLPGHRRGARVAGGERPQPLVRDRRAGRPPGAGAQGVLFAHGSRFGGHALYVKDNRLHYVYNFVGHDGAEDRRHRGPARRARTCCCRRRSTRTARIRRTSPPGSSRSTTATRRSARAGSRPSPASSCSPERACASGATAASRSPTTTRASAPWASPAARSSGSRST